MSTVPTLQKSNQVEDEEHATFWEHLEELRNILFKVAAIIACGFIAALIFYSKIFEFITLPLKNLDQTKLVMLGPFDGFSTMFKTCFWVGLVGTSPMWMYFILQFIAPALRLSNRKLLMPMAFMTLFFLTLGILFAFFLTIPFANHYFSDFNQAFGQNLWTLPNYLNYTLFLALANGLVFETVAVLFLLIHYGIISKELMIEKRRPAIVLIFILSALLTPPDVLTLLLMAFPLMGFYELGILYARWRKKLTG